MRRMQQPIPKQIVTARAEHLPFRLTSSRSRVTDVMAENGLLAVLIALFGAVLLVIGPKLFVPDSWLTLVAGREVAHHGLPHHETLTTLSAGHRWTDQQWLAQFLYYVAG